MNVVVTAESLNRLESTASAAAATETLATVHPTDLVVLIECARQLLTARRERGKAFARVRDASDDIARFWNSHTDEEDLQDDAIYGEWRRLFAEYNEAQRRALEIVGRTP